MLGFLFIGKSEFGYGLDQEFANSCSGDHEGSLAPEEVRNSTVFDSLIHSIVRMASGTNKLGLDWAAAASKDASFRTLAKRKLKKSTAVAF